MFEEDQGFANDIKTELVQVNFIPLLPPKKHQQKPLLTPLMLHNRKIGTQYLLPLNVHLEELKGEKIFDCLNEDMILRNKKLARKGGGSITFQSSFDNGNLQQVKYEKGVYHLFIRPDSNTKSHCQWFYFIAKTKEKTHATFILHNFAKRNMLYLRGLRPYYRSIKQNQNQYTQISNQPEYNEDLEQQEQERYCLKFYFEFSHADEVQFCSQPPYTLQRLENLSIPSFFRRVQLTRSLLGQPVYAFFVNEKAKGTVVVFARQHPGESVGSWMMEGLMKKLFSCDPTVCWILVPMLNVDGVKIGNNRTGLLGYDLNRCWDIEDKPLRQHLFPELMGVIKYFRQDKKRKQNGIKMFIDLHGHSSEPNVFSYGPPLPPESLHYSYSRLFPYLISLNSKFFNLQQCSYELPINKRNCARSFFFNKLGFPYSYTIESSFGIYNNKNINEDDILQVGEDICVSIIKFIVLLTKKTNSIELERNIKDMQKLPPPPLCSHTCESSDSDFDDQAYKPPQRFKSSSNILISKILNGPIRKKFWADLGEQQTSIHTRDLSIQEKKGRRSQRQQTQQVKNRYKSHRQAESEKSKHILPPIKNLKIHFPNQKKAKDPLKRKLSLKQVTEKLISLRHNKIGRRIVILNDYPTTSH